MKQALISHRTFFDRVLGEYEAGHPEEAALMLSGMLDAVLGQGERLSKLRREFFSHPLASLCLVAAKPGNRLGDAVSRLGFARGLLARRELGAQAIEQTWMGGRQILISDCGERGELRRLNGRALDNVVLEHADPLQENALRDRFGLSAAEPGQRFDLIVATSWADNCKPSELGSQVERAAERLSPTGRLLLSAFVPGHLGWGWQAVCMGRDLHCHDEQGLAAVAAKAGLAINQFRDGSGSLIWAELQKTGAESPTRGQP